MIILLLSIISISIARGGTSKKLKVTASIYPLAYFAGQVGGDHAEVISTMPTGSEPHSYEPTAQDMKHAYRSDVFIFNGLGIDFWADRIHDNLKAHGVSVIKMSEHFGNREKNYARDDPHIWLDPLLALKEVEIIREAFINVDPVHEDVYRNNSDTFIRRLKVLHDKFVAGLSSCKNRQIIVTHDAYNYLSARYNIITHPISGLSPEEEPSVRKLGELSKLAIENNIRHVFFEELVSPRLAQTLSRETGASTLILSPLGQITRDQAAEGKTYFSIMEENLRNLQIAMECD